MTGFGPDFSEELIRRQEYRAALAKEEAKDERKNPIKQACEIATSTNITLSGLQTIQGHVGKEGDRVLVKHQTDPKMNGIWEMNTTAWHRSYDADTANALSGAMVGVLRGTFADTLFMQITDDIIMESSDIVFEPITSSGGGSGPVTWGDILGNVADQTDLQTAFNEKQNAVAGNNNALIFKNDSGTVESNNEYTFDTETNGLSINNSIIPLATTDAKTLHNLSAMFNPTVNNAQENWRQLIVSGYIGNDDSGNQLGDNISGGLEIFSASVNSFNKSNVGQARSISAYGSFGNATDPMNVRSYAAYGGNLQVRNNVTSGYVSVLEYGFNLESGSTVDDLRGFNLNGNIAQINLGLNGYSLGLNITQGNYANIYSCFNQYGNMSGGINVFGDFSSLTGVGSNIYFSFTAQPNLANVNGYNGLNINPTIGTTPYATGINVDMSNVTVFAGTKGSVTIQDIYFETVNPTGDSFTIQFVDDATAGSETVLNAGADVTVHIQSGVSTATQIKAAWDTSGIVAANINATITGLGSNSQTAVSPQSLTGGQYPGQKYAAQFKGDVKVDGAFSFTGSLALGLVTAFGQKALHDGGGQPDSAHTIISSLTAADNAVIANADMIGVNTAGLIQIGANATITTSFLGIAALGLPAVVQIGNGTTVDKIAGAVFALSLQGNGTGTIDTLDLCKAVAIPNGFTVVNKLHGYTFDLPFGDPGNETWGLYFAPDKPSWMKGGLKIGGVSGTSDKPTGTNKFQMEGGDFALAADVKSGFFGTSPVVQPASSGAATASGLYTSTEQTMLQEVYDAVRALGLMS